MTPIEERRQQLQKQLDAQKGAKERNVLGQFATPYALACEIMQVVKGVVGDGDVSFLEPAVGLGAFYSAAVETFGGRMRRAVGFEVDGHYGRPAQALWRDFPMDIRIADFLRQEPPAEKFNCLVANPPYVRHHHIEAAVKASLRGRVERKLGIKVSALAGLYCHFMLLSASWLAEGGVSAWLVPAEFLDVNYGVAVKQFLVSRVRLLRVHRFEADSVQFDDALVSSCVVLFQNLPPGGGPPVELTSGGSLKGPASRMCVPLASLRPSDKWTPLFSPRAARPGHKYVLGDFFKVKRGVATGDNGFFIVKTEEARAGGIADDFLVPIMPAPRHLPKDVTRVEESGLSLFSCAADEQVLRSRFPSTWRYVEQGASQGVPSGYICRQRRPWYCCPRPAPAPFVIPYMGRTGGAFRFIWNEGRLVTANVYLNLHPLPQYAAALRHVGSLQSVWRALNSIPPDVMEAHGRVYGGGLRKFEPGELMGLPADGVAEVLLPLSAAPSLCL